MRVGFLTYGLDRSPTGIGRYAVELLRALVSTPGAPEVVVLATEREDAHGLRNTCEYHRLAGNHLLPSLLTIGNAVIPAAARRYHLDVIHDPNGIAPFLGPRGGVCRIVTIYDAFAYVIPDVHNRLDNWRYRWHLPHAARRSDAIVTVSDSSRRDIIRYLGLRPEAVQITSGGVQPHFRPVTNDGQRQALLARYGIHRPYILYVGGLNARKNVGRLLEAFNGIREQYPDLALVIGGKRQWRTAEIDEAFTRLALEDHVLFTGYVDDADLPALYSAAVAFVFPSLYEGFGLPPLEAMACGTPVITSNVSSLPEVVGDAALTVDPFDVPALTSAIAQLLGDDTLRASLRERGLVRAATFRWEHVARDTIAIYDRTLNSSLSSPAPGDR